MSNIYTTTLTGAVIDEDAIALSQTPAGAGNLTLNGTLASGGVATLVPAGRVSITSAGNVSNRTFTITGTDNINGYPLVVTLTGPNNSTVATTIDFRTVTSIAISGAAGAALTVGTNGVASTPWYPGDYKTGKLPVITVALSTGAVLTYTVEFTPTDLNDQTLSIDAQKTQAQNAVVFPSTDTNVVGASASMPTNFVNGMPGMRVTINTYTSGSLTMTVISPNNHTF